MSAAYDDDGVARELHASKLDALRETVEQLGGEHCIVYYLYRFDIPRIEAALRNLGLVVKLYTDGDALNEWNEGKVDVLIAHAASVGFGLNLQAGGRHIVWYGLPWSLELYQQAIARLHRQGQEKPVVVHRLIVTGYMDERVRRALDNKRAGQDELMEALAEEFTIDAFH